MAPFHPRAAARPTNFVQDIIAQMGDECGWNAEHVDQLSALLQDGLADH